MPATITCRENIEIYCIFSFLFFLHYYKYRLLRRHTTIADYLTTIRRLFRDCPATIPGTRREPREDLRTVPERARRSSGREVWRQERRRAAGGAGSKGGRQYRESAERGRECGRIISRRRGECFYLRRNCPLNARLRSRGIPIYPRYKRAVYARFRGYFATVQKNRPGIFTRAARHSARGSRRWSWGRCGGLELDTLHRAGDSEKPRQASSLSGRVFTWSFSPRQ